MKKLKFLICFMFTLILLFQQTDVVDAKGDSVSQDIIGTGNYGDNLTWILYNDGTLIISGEGDMEDYFDMSYYYKSEVKNVVILLVILIAIMSACTFVFYQINQEITLNKIEKVK